MAYNMTRSVDTESYRNSTNIDNTLRQAGKNRRNNKKDTKNKNDEGVIIVKQTTIDSDEKQKSDFFSNIEFMYSNFDKSHKMFDNLTIEDCVISEYFLSLIFPSKIE